MKKIYLLILCLFISNLLFGQIHYSIDFENGFEDWQATGDWETGSAADAGFIANPFLPIPEHTTFAYLSTTNDGIGWVPDMDGAITSPLIDFTNYSNNTVLVDFDYNGFISDNGFTEGEHAIYISNDNGTTWELAHSINAMDSFTEWQEFTINISEYVNGEILFRFSYAGSENAMGVAVDNFNIYSPEGADVKLAFVPGLDADNPENFDISINLIIENVGDQEINSLEVVLDDGNSLITQTLSDMNLTPGTYQTYTLPEMFNTGQGNYPLSITLLNPNGVLDINSEDNGFDIFITTYPMAENKAVLFQSSTGTWCSGCTEGYIRMQHWEEKYEDLFVGMEMHFLDVMEMEPEGNYDYLSEFIADIDNTAPVAVIDKFHVQVANSEDYLAHKMFLQRLGEEPEAHIEVSHYEVNFDNGILTTTLEITANVAGSYNVNSYLVEDEVTGQGDDYAQSNYWAGFSAPYNINPYASLPSLIPASMMVYHQVARGQTSGYVGESVGTPMEAGEVRTVTISGPAILDNVDENHIRVAAVVLNSSTNVVTNATWANTDSAVIVGIDEPDSNRDQLFKLYPNPANDFVRIDFTRDNLNNSTIEIYDGRGRKVISEHLDHISESQYFNLAGLDTGVYSIIITSEDSCSSKKIMVQRN